MIIVITIAVTAGVNINHTITSMNSSDVFSSLLLPDSSLCLRCAHCDLVLCSFMYKYYSHGWVWSVKSHRRASSEPRPPRNDSTGCPVAHGSRSCAEEKQEEEEEEARLRSHHGGSGVWPTGDQLVSHCEPSGLWLEKYSSRSLLLRRSEPSECLLVVFWSHECERKRSVI